MMASPCYRIGPDYRIDGLVAGTCPIVEPGAGEIRVRVQASSLNYADYGVITGMVSKDCVGRIPLNDGAGMVDAVGPGVDQWAVGDLVMTRFYPEWDGGPYRSASAAQNPGTTIDGHATQYLTSPASWFTRVPYGYDAAEAATLGCAALTAWRALFVETTIRPGDWVMTQGTGGVSIFALQFAKACGARVIATTSSDEKADRLRALGADHVINYREDAGWGETAFALADGRGCDAIIEIGGGSSLAQSFAAVREAGFIGLIGILASQRGSVPTMALMRKNARLQGLTVGSLDQLLAMIDAIDASGIRPVIAARYPLDRLVDAFAHQMQGRHIGKIVIDI